MKKILIPALTLLVLTNLLSSGRTPVSSASSPRVAPRFEIKPDFGRMPLFFVPQGSEAGRPESYAIQGRNRSISLAPGGLIFVLSEGTSSESARRWIVKLDFLGANPNVRPEPRDRMSTVVSSFRGSPDRWRTGLPTFAKIAYANLWPGIDLIYSGTPNKLKYDLIVHPGADPSRIRMAYRGATEVGALAEGGIEVRTPAGSFEDGKPTAYQEIAGKRVVVPVAYELQGKPESNAAGQAYGFRVGAYDRTQTLVLDPFINVYSGFIGGADEDLGLGIALDSSGCAYVVGSTLSSEASFPATVGPYLASNGGIDAFVAKVNASGTGLVYCGYIGGSENDIALGVAVDSAGKAYIAGVTSSSEVSFPVVKGPSLTYSGGTIIPEYPEIYGDAFVARVNASGTGLDYCGYIGGTGNEAARGIAVNSLGQAHVIGVTSSSASSFPEVNGPGLTLKDTADAFVAKVKADGSGLDYCGYIGGSDGDSWGMGIALDASGYAYVAGYTKATEADFPATFGPDLIQNGGYDAFVAKITPAGTGFSYCGFIGGSGDDRAYGIALDSQGCAYLTGSTTSGSDTFPKKVGPSLVPGGSQDAFAAKVAADGASLVYCGYIGGSQNETGTAIAVTTVNNKPTAFVTGGTNSSKTEGFPVEFGPSEVYGGSGDAFLARVTTTGAYLVYCGYIGGSGTEDGLGLAVDGQGAAYVCGRTKSTTDFPTAAGPDLTHNGGYDAFVAKISCGLISPDLSNPPNGAQGQPVNGINFRWTDPNSAPQEGGYKLRLKYAGAASYTEYADIPADSTAQTIGSSDKPFAKNSILYWNVKARSSNFDDFPESAWANGGADFVFRTEGGASVLFAPTLVSPSSGSANQPTSLNLTWLDPNASPQETKYRIRVKPAGGSYANYLVGQNVTTFFLTGRAANKAYSWNVQAVGNGGTLPDSPWANGGVDWTFKTAAPVKLNPPLLVSPANGATGQPLSVTLAWTDTNSSPQEVSYQVRVKIAGGSYTIFTTARDAVSYLKSNLRSGKTYFWNVRAKGDKKGVLNSNWANSGVDWKLTTQ